MQITKSKKQMPKCPCEITKWRFQIRKYRILMQITKRQNSDQANYKRPSEFSYRFLVALKSGGDFKRVGRKQRVRLQLGK